MRLGAYASALAVALLALGVAHAQDESVQKMVGTWKGKIELLDQPDRTLIVKSVTRAGGIWIASVEYGPTGQKLDAFEGRVEQARGAPTLTFHISTTRKVELALVSQTELRGQLKINAEGSWVGRKMLLTKSGAKS
ncbi:MAG TPA: hypothetical protein VKG20_04615 [Methylomirabilota bacterium]|nr:hypothetical protein [Methylomirabilota bacterium]